jgi:hypothetical protein
MQAIRPILALNQKSPDVANLHAALDRLQFGRPITEPERTEKLYGQGTFEAVRELQRQFGIVTRQFGIVEEQTAESINRRLFEMGVFRLVEGRITNRDGSPVVGNLLFALDKDNISGTPLGQTNTNEDGHYQTYYDPLLYSRPGEGVRRVKEVIDLIVQVYDANGATLAESTPIHDPASEIRVDLKVGELPASNGFFHVVGRVASNTRAGVGGLRIVIVDKNVGGDLAVGNADTGAGGSYHAAFPYAGPKQKPDLQARAFRGRTLVGASEVRYNAAIEETLDVLVMEGADAALETEHETLTNALAGHFTGNLRDLKETDEQQDVTYLANKTGWDARAVALASLADQFSARTISPGNDTPIPSALFYALFRAGLPANDAALYRADAATVSRIWKQGIEQGIVPAQVAERIPAAIEQFQALSAREMLKGPAIAGLSSLKEMLSVSLPDAHPDQHEQFAKLQVQHQGDPVKFWEAVETTFGEPAARRLRLDGQLAFLTLNNAPLTAKLHDAAGQTPLADPVNLIEQGYHQPAKWLALLDADAVPPEIKGGDEQKRANYADLLATQLRLSYPTAALAALVKSGDTPTAHGTTDRVHAFLMENHGQFEIGMQPVEQFAVRKQLQLEPEVQSEITRIQRVRQITPSDDAMNALLKRGVDSAYAVTRYDRDEFVDAFKDEVGGATNAALIHAKAQQVHNVVLNIATSYLLASDAPGIGVHSPAQIVAPAPNVPDNTGDVIAYPTLEKLFGEMDYCDCTHCRSILSPAAYLVDLLYFLNRDKDHWEKYLLQWPLGHGNAPYPFGSAAAWDAAGNPSGIKEAPLDVLLSRRPDLQHLPLTCENTNTPLPYIDLVNETLEYFIANELKLDGYTGHTTDDRATPDELMANPQFVQDTAYDILAGTSDPAPLLPPTPTLPFHQRLETLRRYFAAFGTPLPRVMEALRKDDAVERATEDDYGWRDIWMEELRLSRAEYARLTDSTLTLRQLYGFPAATTDTEVLTALSNAKAFTRRLDISYEDLIELLKTRFINPNGTLIPRLERLGVPFTTLKTLKEDETITDEQFNEAIAPHLDASQYGGDIKAWIKDQANYDKIMSLVVLADPTGANNVCSFETLEFRYADPARLAVQVRHFEFVRLIRFIRLWKKLGWSIEQTDKVIAALYPIDQVPNDPDDNVNMQRLDAGFLALLPRLGVMKRVIDSLNLRPRNDLLPLLACFAPIDTYGAVSLYRKLFLSPALLKQAPVFADNGYGNVLDGSKKLFDHQEALRAALTLTEDELTRIGSALGFDADTPLTVDTVSAIFRRGWLARRLKLSIQEFLLLTRFTGIDPFVIEPNDPPMLRFITLVERLRAAALKPSQALYLIWNQDISGTSAPEAGQINEFARSLRAGFAVGESEFAVIDDPDGQIARARMALVYDNPTTDLFFGLLNNTLVSDIPYSHSQATLEEPILDVAPDRIAYDDFRKRLSFAGVMTPTMRDALKVDVSQTFKDAVDALYKENQKIVEPFFQRYPELQPLYDTYVTSNNPVEKKRSTLLENFLPELKRRRKRQQALQAISAAAKTDANFAGAILDNGTVLHAAANKTLPGLDDLVAIEEPGLISGAWSGYLEVPESGFYNIRIEADAGADASIELTMPETDLTMTRNGNLWSNDTALELRAGTLYSFALKAEGIVNTLKVQWQTTGRGWEVIPGRYLYSATLRDQLNQTYVRFFKTVSLAGALKLTVNEIAYLASHPDYQIDGQSWLNSLPVAGSPDDPTSQALFASLGAPLDFARIKAALAPDDERLLAVLKDPAAPIQRPDSGREADTQKPYSLLFSLTRWQPSSLDVLLVRFGKVKEDLAQLGAFRRVFDAYAVVATLGISVEALIAATTNEPAAATVRDLQSALRARYAERDWLNVIKPINDELRGLQRDASVAYILHQLRANPISAHIDTPDKLFEYFLMDVQMEPCMQTSRIRHALSSVQLFIERCLMNLEPRVASATLNAKHWQWMKRYRVWEANRKVFLWPENWLEPELRDDQSPFFKEAMSELLQGDITEDRAAVALVNYLSKLDEVAKLEPCGIHYVEDDPETKAVDDIAHVVARTVGASRKYFYRRLEYGHWTPWEQIKLDIEDNPVIPVVWKDRLFLFWLRILKQAPTDGQKPISADKDVDLTQVKVGQINVETPKVKVQLLLCWSEYYNGQWQPTKTSDVNRPATLSKKTFLSRGIASSQVREDVLFEPTEFDRSALTLSVRQIDNALKIIIAGPRGSGNAAFFLYNTHSLPVREEDLKQRPAPPIDSARYLRVDGEKLIAAYKRGPISTERSILNNTLGGLVVGPNHDLANPWDAPFFYEDRRHVFYVTTTEQPVTISDHKGYPGLRVIPFEFSRNIPPLVQQPIDRIKDRLVPVSDDQHHGISNTAPLERFVSEDAYIRRALGTVGPVRFNGKELGPSGALTIRR